MRSDHLASIRFQTPELPPLDAVAEYFAMAEEARWFSNGGPCHEMFTERIEGRLGRGIHTVLVANGTLGLMVALRALTEHRLPQRREVLVPSFTFAATVNAIMWCGLTPVFGDVDPRNWHLRPSTVAAAVRDRGDRLAAVLACSTFGTPPPPAVRQEWERLCSAADVPLLVDSAAAFGAVDGDGIPLGGQGHAELFSFHATKPFAIGEGGAVTTRDGDLASRIARLANFGFDEQRVVSGPVGLNAKMSEIQAATGLAMLDRIDDVLARRRAAAESARGPLEEAGYAFQQGCELSTWQFMPALAPDSSTRDRLLDLGARMGIQIRSYFSPLHTAPAFAGYERVDDLATTLEISSRVVSLPLSNTQTPAEATQILSCASQAVSATPSRPAVGQQ